jgi:FAD/FMN-containing dehydrogenase
MPRMPFRSIVDIIDFMFAEQKRSGVLLAGLEHLDDRYLKAVGYATKSKRASGTGGFVQGLPKMVLVGDIAGDDADAVARVTSEVVRLANSARWRGFCRHQRRGAQEVLARPQAHGRHLAPHQRVQDQ